MEQSAFQRDKALSTPHELVYTGPIESLAKNVGYTCWDAKGKPLDYGLGFRTKPPHTEPLKGEWITGGDLGFDLEKTRVVLTQLGVITGKESANSCSWDKNKPVNPARFRLFSEVDQLVDDAGELSKKDLHKSLRSARKGALETRTVSFTAVKENDGKEHKWGLRPGQVGIPPCWGTMLGKYLSVRNYYFLGDFYVSGDKRDSCDLERELGLVCGVLGDTKFKINGDAERVRFYREHLGNEAYSFWLRTDISGKRDWLIESFQPTLERMMEHPDFREAFKHYVQLSQIDASGRLAPSKVICQQKQSTNSPYNADLGEMVFKHYDPPLSRMAKAAEKDKEMMTLLRLV